MLILAVGIYSGATTCGIANLLTLGRDPLRVKDRVRVGFGFGLG